MIRINKSAAKRIAGVAAPIIVLVAVVVITLSNVLPYAESDSKIPEHEDDGQLIPFGDVRQLSVFDEESTNTILGHIENSIVSMSDAYKTSENYDFIIADIVQNTFKQSTYDYPKLCSFVLVLDTGVKYNVWVRVEDQNDITTLVEDPSGIFYVNSTTRDPNALSAIERWLKETINETPEIHYMERAFDVNSIPGFDDL